MALVYITVFLVLLFLTCLMLWLPVYLSFTFFEAYLLWSVPLALILSPFFLLVFYGALNFLIKKPKAGEHHNFSPVLMLQWGLKRNLYGVYALFFQKLLFLSDPLRFLILRTFQARIHPSSWITSSVRIFEPYFVSVGKKTLIGEEAILATTILPKTKTLMTYPIRIGDHVLIGGFAGIGPGCVIEDHCFIQQRAQIYAKSHIKKNSLVGYESIIGKNTVLEENVKVGKFCFLGNDLKIPTGTKIPDYTVLKTKEALEVFLQESKLKTQEPEKNLEQKSTQKDMKERFIKRSLEKTF